MELLLIFAVLVCPIVMGGMMVVMMRQMRSGGARRDRADEDPPR